MAAATGPSSFTTHPNRHQKNISTQVASSDQHLPYAWLPIHFLGANFWGSRILFKTVGEQCIWVTAWNERSSITQLPMRDR